MYVDLSRASSGCGVLNLANSERRSALTMCRSLCYLRAGLTRRHRDTKGDGWTDN